jgi:hypothetical protein
MKTTQVALPIKIQETETIIYLRQNELGDWVSLNDYVLTVKVQDSEFQEITISEKDDRLQSIENQDLATLFLAKHQEQEERNKNIKASGIEQDDDTEEVTIPKPDFDPEQIRLDMRIFSLSDIIRFISQDRIDLSPDFQRFFVWEKEKKSRLIESLLLKIPLPMFYLAENHAGLYQVVDGVQRLTTIKAFMNNKLVLQDLEYLADCEGKTFSTLLPKYQRRLEDTQFTFNIIAPTTPISVKTEIFKRLNLGGKALSRQEIRNSLSIPHVRRFIHNLVATPSFKEATGNSVKPLRMDDQELAMRFIAFYLVKIEKFSQYKGDMENFLDEVLDYLNRYGTSEKFAILERDFQRGMQNAFHLFGKYTFRKVMPHNIEKNDKPPINKSLFTAWSVMLSQYDTDFVVQNTEKDSFVSIFIEEIKENTEYLDALTTGTNQATKLDYSFAIAQKLIDTHLKISSKP